MKRRISDIPTLTVTLAVALALGCGSRVVPQPVASGADPPPPSDPKTSAHTTCEGDIDFPDPRLELTVRAHLDGFKGQIRAERLAGLTDLSAVRATISDLTNIHCLADLTTLDLFQNRLTDLRPLANTTQLRELYLGGNELADIADLAALHHLQLLDLRINRISDLGPLAGSEI